MGWQGAKLDQDQELAWWPPPRVSGAEPTAHHNCLTLRQCFPKPGPGPAVPAPTGNKLGIPSQGAVLQPRPAESDTLGVAQHPQAAPVLGQG